LNDKVWIKLEIIDTQLHIDFMILLIKALSNVSKFFDHNLLLLLQFICRFITDLFEVLIFLFFFIK